MENAFPVPLLYDMGKIFRDTAAELVVKPVQHVAVLVQIRSLLQYRIFCGYILLLYKGKLHKQTELFLRPLLFLIGQMLQPFKQRLGIPFDDAVQDILFIFKVVI